MKKLLLVLGSLGLCVTAALAAPMGTGFTYQGRLSDGSAPANGSYDFTFTLHGDSSEALYFGDYIIRSAVPVTNGLFTVELNSAGEFGPMAFNGDARWLQIGVRTNGNWLGKNWTFLAPRQPLTPVPYALMAGTVPDGAITSSKIANGAVSAQQIAAGGIAMSNLAAGSITSDKLAAGAVTSDKLALGSAAANLLESGQSGVGGGGVIFSEFANATNLLGAGYSKLTLQPLDLSTEKWTKHIDAPVLPGVVQSMRRTGYSVVWTGKEWIIWAGFSSDAASYLNTGARYNPSNGVWTVMNTNNAPSARTAHSAVWTGTEMIIWGGRASAADLNNGGRYNPVTDTWTPIGVAGAPAARSGQFAVWTGTQMIIWGGYLNSWDRINTGARYTPGNDTWSPMATAGAPSLYSGSTAVWAGNYLVVWGGVTNVNGDDYSVRGGARYNLANNTWYPITTNGAPSARSGHVAVSSGTEMIVFGGLYANPAQYELYELNGGGRYNPATDTWTPLPPPGPEPRVDAHAVWSGSEMIVFGGYKTVICGYWGNGLCPAYFDGGLRYRPSNNTWNTVATNATPNQRGDYPPGNFTMTWGGSKALIWGGDFNMGDLYDPTNNTWTTTTPAPSGDTTERTEASTVWTGTEMIVWGGVNREGVALRSGLRYNPSTKAWKVLNVTGAPSPRKWHSAVWTGTEMIVFGGNTAAGPTNNGARYNPVADTWTPLPTNAAPVARQQHAAVWTGHEMIVWGGSMGFVNTDTGARWNPAANTWTPLSSNNAPTPRQGHTAVWTGHEMIVWGGSSGFFSSHNSGARYNPANDTWTPTSLSNAPAGRLGHSVAWNGSEMIVWGGYAPIATYTGGRYSPAADSWTSMNETGAPAVSFYGTASAQNKFIVWGGLNNSSQPVNTGAVYDLESDKWTSTLVTNNFVTQMPNPRYSPAACWTGTEMLIWGGMNGPDNPVADTYSYAPARRFYLYLKP